MAARDEQPLPAGWTQHVAPTGHYYYYNAATKVSTYDRPGAGPAAETAEAAEPAAGAAGPAVAAGLAADPGPGPAAAYSGKYSVDGTGKAGSSNNPHMQRKRRKEVARIRRPLSLKPWDLVVTNHGRPFFYNRQRKVSLWTPPADVYASFEEIPRDEVILLIARCRGLRMVFRRRPRVARKPKSGVAEAGAEPEPESEPEPEPEPATFDQTKLKDNAAKEDDMDDAKLLREMNRGSAREIGFIPQRKIESEDEYTTGSDSDESDDDMADLDEAERLAEYNEDDIEWQIQAMMAESMGADEEGQEEAQAAAVASFMALLDAGKLNPFSPWETELQKVVHDPRFMAIRSNADRKALFDEWAKVRVVEVRAEKAHEVRRDPQDEFLDFLRLHATTKLFYTEFKRKFRKDPGFRDSKLLDRQKEKLYREYVDELKKRKK
ncbi:uncharacterized protein V1510DRAFT_361510 [Dipodascopsis tothii]|uniref:uncharacterized protein n=1 Tax=Dipodascopsis tothii TaxID=44089 RepID=UPI0034CF11DA